MTDNSESSGDAQITFKVKSGSDTSHVITMSEAATVLDLKTKLAESDFENIPVERQRLIYSGRVMKNDDSLSTYKIKHNNTIHMVKSAASNQNQPSTSASTSSTPRAVPTNMASGTANNPLAGLTGARYAGHQVNLPGLDMFGPDGGMGPPMDEERMQRLMSDPNVQQSMTEALNNPDFVNMLVESNPMLRNMPNAREIITSPFMRQMMSNPSMMSQAMRMQRNMQRGGSFPAPGATDDASSEGATTGANNETGNNNNNNNTTRDPSADLNNLFMPFPMPNASGDQAGSANWMASAMRALQEMGGSPFAPPPTAGQTDSTQTGTGSTGTEAGGTPGQQSTPNAAANPFGALFGGNLSTPPPMANPEAFRQLMEMMGAPGGGAAASAPADTRPPEERYEQQLRQLNDMGFFDFDRNVAALRRSGGSVQGAIEHLLGGN